MIFHRQLQLWAFTAACVLGTEVCPADIAQTKHNLSVSGPGPIKSATEEEICIFCHTPHRARTDIPFLWNREDSVESYTTYESSTLYALVGQPSGASKLCLSCHDGTIALGAVLSRDEEIVFEGGIRFLPQDRDSYIGTDLSDDHPVSFLYDDALAAERGDLVPPSSLTEEVQLDKDEMLQCTSCHDPHDDTLEKFLVETTQESALCLTCHRPTDWSASAHATSLATWNGIGADPWPHTPYSTVAENACENCHRPHTAGGHERILNYLIEEDNCLVCHNGNVASTDIEDELLKPVYHPVDRYTGIHDPVEDFTGFVSSHVECVDCHNPHRVNDRVGIPPEVPGALEGVVGITTSNQQVEEAQFLYEVCFKCHADNNVLSFAEITRVLTTLNTRLEFDLTNPSYHPVEGAGRNANVPSLIAPLTESSVIYCTACHNNDEGPDAGGLGPDGPHGSTYDFLLERNYNILDFVPESSFEYALCYKCHDRNRLLDPGISTFPHHARHVQGGPRLNAPTPCSTCHDPHGVSSALGATALNHTHLINFNVNIVEPVPGQVVPLFEDLGEGAGRCYVNCHGNLHNPRSYGPGAGGGGFGGRR